MQKKVRLRERDDSNGGRLWLPLDLRLVVWTVGLLVTLGLAHNLCENSEQVIPITITQLSQASQSHTHTQRDTLKTEEWGEDSHLGPSSNELCELN